MIARKELRKADPDTITRCCLCKRRLKRYWEVTREEQGTITARNYGPSCIKKLTALTENQHEN